MPKKKLKKETIVVKIKIPKSRLPKGIYTRIHKDKKGNIIDKIHKKEIREAGDEESHE